MWWTYDPEYPYTVEEAVAYLPPEFSVTEEMAQYADYDGPWLRTGYIQSYISFNANSSMLPAFFADAMWALIGLVIVVAGIRRLVHASPRLPKPLRRLNTLITKHLFMTSAFGGKSAAEPVSYIGARGALRRWTSVGIPLRIHAILAAFFFFANIGIMFSPYYITHPNVYWFDLGYPWGQYLRGFADRTGVLSISFTPLLILLAARNSPLVWITGADYSVLQIYHRWVSRVVVLHAIGHTLGYSAIEAYYDYFFRSFEEAYWNWGWAAVVGGTFMCLAATRRLRELSYEAFLYGHIAGAIVWIVGCYYHVWLLDPEYSYLKFLYASMAFWGFDRFARWAMTVYYHAPRLSKSSTPKSAAFAAEGYLIGSGSYLRLRLNPTRTWPKLLGGPGTYVFIRSLDRHIFESHPFTMAWPANMPSIASPGWSPSSNEESVGKKSFLENGGAHAFDTMGTESSTEFELILKSYSGYTKSLAKHLSDTTGTIPEASAHPVKTVKLLVEGPYGAATSLSHYDSVLLVAGGSGISASVSHLADMAKGAVNGGLKVNQAVLVWAIRDIHAVDVLVPYLLRLRPYFASSSLRLAVHIHYTGESNASGKDEEKHAASTSSLATITSLCASAASFAAILVRAGRPDIDNEISAVIDADSNAKIAVAACGPESLCDTTRVAVRGRLGGKFGLESDQLVYHEESFTW